MSSVAVIFAPLPILVFLQLWILFHSRPPFSDGDHDWRDSFLKAAVAWAGLTYAFTEILSLRSALRMIPLAAVWFASFLLGCALVANRRPKLRLPRFTSDVLLLAGIGVVLAITGFIGLYSAPTNWDSMTYHLARVGHWSANGSIAHYPTSTLRQLWMSPLAEYIVLHFYVLSGESDRLVNLVQWFCLVGSVIAVSRITARLGQSRFAQVAAAFMAATTPILILESSSTQTDLVCAFFVAATVLFLQCEEPGWTALSLSLAVLAKPSAVLFLFPFFLVAGVREYRSRNWVRTLQRAGVCVLALVVTTGPFWMRNRATFGNATGDPQVAGKIESRALGSGALLSNITRNLALEAATPIRKVNGFTESLVRKLHRRLGLDPDDPRITFPGTRFGVPLMSGHEDREANPFEVVLLIIATIALAVGQQSRRSRTAIFACCVWAGFLLFCWNLRWQPWHARLHIPFLLLASVPIAVFLAQLRHRKPIAVTAILVFAAVSAVPFLVLNESRPLLSYRGRVSIFARPHTEEYFADRPALFRTYTDVITVLSRTSCRDVGMVGRGEDGWEYPLWALARSRGSRTEFRDWNVTNPSANTAARTTLPCAVVSFPVVSFPEGEPFAPPRDDIQLEIRLRSGQQVVVGPKLPSTLAVDQVRVTNNAAPHRLRTTVTTPKNHQ